MQAYLFYYCSLYFVYARILGKAVFGGNRILYTCLACCAVIHYLRLYYDSPSKKD
jgi:hypothetical protein